MTDIEVLPEEKQDKTEQNKAITKNERKETNRSSMGIKYYICVCVCVCVCVCLLACNMYA